MRHISTMALMGLLFILAACGQKEAPAIPGPVAEATPPQTVDADAEAEAARRAAEEATRRAAEEASRLQASLAEKVYFDYDVATIRDDQKRILDAKVAILRDRPEIRIRIEGHADDRGSTEYNLALSERRADAVKAYLTDFGLDGLRFETVSYGEERPVVVGRDERSWAQNRRGEFVVMAGTVADSGGGGGDGGGG